MNVLSPGPNHARRSVAAALIAAPALWLGAHAQALPARRATPAQTEGPFYPVAFPKDSDHDLLRNGALAYGRGQPSWVEGAVTDPDGKPVRGAVVEIWQCDEAGRYHHPGDGNRADAAFQGFGKVTVGRDVLGNANDFSGSIEATSSIGPVKIGRDLKGLVAGGAFSGRIVSRGSIASISIGGSIEGGVSRVERRVGVGAGGIGRGVAARA